MTSLGPNDPVAVIGAGTMGCGIVQVAAAAGHPVLVFDARAGEAAKAPERIGAPLARLVEKGRMTAAERQAILDRIEPCAALSAFAPARLVIEAVFEDLEVKRALFREVEGIVAADAILATNTSSLSVTAIGAALDRPERFAGMHFFNPAPLMPLVEVVSGVATDPAVAAAVFDAARAWGKSPVHARATPGFIVNRVARPFYGEGFRILEEGGADPATIDAVLREAGGFRMGPFELTDLIGQDVNHAVSRSVFEAYAHDPRYRPSLRQRELVEAGRLGRKSGRGWYDYAEGAERPAPATAAPGARPAGVRIDGDLGPAAALADRIAAAGIPVARGAAEGPGALVLDGATLRLTDGRMATARAAAGPDPAGLVLFDLALDYGRATRLAIAPADQAAPAAVAAAAGLLQALGIAVSVVDDVPGMIVMRTVAMLANEAADAVNQGVAAADGIDDAMRLGVNYPQGPLVWADAIGPATVLAVLDNLAWVYGEDRYRASPLLRRKVAAGAGFRG